MTKLNLVKGKTVDETDTTSNGISFAGDMNYGTKVIKELVYP